MAYKGKTFNGPGPSSSSPSLFSLPSSSFFLPTVSSAVTSKLAVGAYFRAQSTSAIFVSSSVKTSPITTTSSSSETSERSSSSKSS